MSGALSSGMIRILAGIRESPEFFFREVLGDEPTPEQVLIGNSVRDNRRTCVKSGHSCGKDWDAARIGLWFHVAHYPSIVVVTGPTDRQVKNIVWGEISTAYKRAKIPIGGRLLTQELQSGDKAHYMIGYTAESSESFQGFHSDNVLIIVTEASGIKPEIWKGVDALMTARHKAKLLAVGNAIYEPGSEFAAMFTEKAAIYKPFTLDSRKSPYCSKEWIDEMRTLYGEGSPVWLARVEGIFATDIADTLIPLGWIERSHILWTTYQAGEFATRTLGVDVARFGSDETVFVLGSGDAHRVLSIRQGQDLMQTTGMIVDYQRQYNIPWRHVRIDDTGIGGGVTDRLRELGHDPTPINFGGSASNVERFANTRAEMFFSLRERFRTGTIAIEPTERKLLRDLSTIKYKMTSKGQHQLEPKADMKKRLGYSPDRADALALAAIPQSIASQVSSGRDSNDGLLGWMQQEATRLAEIEKSGGRDKPAAKIKATEIPGAAQILERGRDADAQKRSEDWHSFGFGG